MIELREQEMRGGSSDVGRSITTYLMGAACQSSQYLKEGVRRIAQAWVESRRMHKDLESSEFQAAWNKIKVSGFSHAYESLQEMANKARALGFHEDCQKVEQQEAKFREVFENPTEELDQY